MLELEKNGSYLEAEPFSTVDLQCTSIIRDHPFLLLTLHCDVITKNICNCNNIITLTCYGINKFFLLFLRCTTL